MNTNVSIISLDVDCYYILIIRLFTFVSFIIMCAHAQHSVTCIEMMPHFNYTLNHHHPPHCFFIFKNGFSVRNILCSNRAEK